MIRRLIALILVVWAFGFMWFAVALPQPVEAGETDAIVVPTGSGGRIPRGIALLRAGAADRLLVTGVDDDVKPAEFAAEYDVSPSLMECCVTLGFAALDTRGNARETAEWVANEGAASIRLVTADWHMRRAALELAEALPDNVAVVRDAVRTEPSLATLLIEYHKLLAVWLTQGFPV